MHEETLILLNDLMRQIGRVREAIGERTLAEYSESWRTRYAVERAVEIISEASRRLPESVKDRRPEIPWRKIAGVGNVLRHEYHRIVDHVIFEVVRDEIPRLEAAVIALKATLADNN